MSLPKLTIFFNGCVIAQQLNVVLFTHMFIVVLEITWDKIIENNAFFSVFKILKIQSQKCNHEDKGCGNAYGS